MKQEQKDQLENVSRSMGFDYAMVEYSDHAKIRDPEFHRRLREYLTARASLEFYVTDDVEGVDQ